jgi:hypothetical protein
MAKKPDGEVKEEKLKNAIKWMGLAIQGPLT